MPVVTVGRVAVRLLPARSRSGPLRRSEVLFGLFGLVTLMWGLRSVTFVAESIPAQWWALWRFYFQAMSAGASAALALFALRFAGVTRPALERTILVACAIGPW